MPQVVGLAIPHSSVDHVNNYLVKMTERRVTSVSASLIKLCTFQSCHQALRLIRIKLPIAAGRLHR